MNDVQISELWVVKLYIVNSPVISQKLFLFYIEPESRSVLHHFIFKVTNTFKGYKCLTKLKDNIL